MVTASSIARCSLALAVCLVAMAASALSAAATCAEAAVMQLLWQWRMRCDRDRMREEKMLEKGVSFALQATTPSSMPPHANGNATRERQQGQPTKQRNNTINNSHLTKSGVMPPPLQCCSKTEARHVMTSATRETCSGARVNRKTAKPVKQGGRAQGTGLTSSATAGRSRKG